MQKLCSDLEAQYLELDTIVAGLDEPSWFATTPFCGWTIFDQVAHVAFFDHQALLAIETPAAFTAGAATIWRHLKSEGEWPPKTNPLLGPDRPDELLPLWRNIRTDLLDRLYSMPPKQRIAWFGPQMSARSFTTARLMETWAHTQDVCDTLRLPRRHTARLRHIAHMGVTTFAWSFNVRKLPPPDIVPRMELSGPSGEQWTWGPPEAAQRVSGSALDFCLVVTQRRHLADTGLECRGDIVRQWLIIAQAFAGIAQDPPAPGERET